MQNKHERKHGFERVGVLYALALSGIAAAIIISQLFIQRYIGKQEYDSRIVNLAGRQRMLSQKISKLALQIANTDQVEERQKHAAQLREALSSWTQSHQGLLNGDEELGVIGEKSATVDSMYQAMTPYYETIVAHAQRILQLLYQNRAIDTTQLQPHIQQILANESGFLESMDDIVFQYDDEARERVLFLEVIELILLGISLTIILFELLFIFRPTARKIRTTIDELMRSEKLARDMSYEMGALYSSLEKSYQELAKVDVKEDQPTVFAKTYPSGDFSYVSDQFAEILGNYPHENNCNLFAWLEQEGYAHDQVQNIHHMVLGNETWYGEVKATSDEGDFVWLDSTIVPTFNDLQEIDSLNFICTNKTERREAEARSHELIKDKIEKELKEQRFRSVLVLEGQEEERKRISRDIHDGIGQLLTALKFTIENINLAPDMPDREAKVRDAQKMLNQVIREVRRVSFNLNPSALSDYGLVPVTRRFCAEASRLSDKTVVFENKTGFINRMDKNIETNLYRIIQEAVNNAIKYSQADEIKVEFSHKAHYLNIEIVDNGVGFDYDHYQKKESSDGTGLGILNMQERTTYINGTFELQSEKGKGTRINIHVSINGRKKRYD
ncbi:sensor histidine kinase [Catalinimonas niigatensis]|uniref:sensor histidine kinase n=1 Tax=Catalinimonas niigatensis TaxID=1397264 RepID=UPI002666FAE5|nr:ATP-binding protein [Catalinimonas niigatensis]WPP52870.1 type IV pili methyl-accepting chemotaxis transducer N-terminal domain-containing protein [Catalinimonas niigatensis]